MTCNNNFTKSSLNPLRVPHRGKQEKCQNALKLPVLPSAERDCWCFFRELAKKHYGIDVPAVDVDLHDLRDIMAKIDREKKARWVQIDAPVDGCADAASPDAGAYRDVAGQ